MSPFSVRHPVGFTCEVSPCVKQLTVSGILCQLIQLMVHHQTEALSIEKNKTAHPLKKDMSANQIISHNQELFVVHTHAQSKPITDAHLRFSRHIRTVDKGMLTPCRIWTG